MVVKSKGNGTPAISGKSRLLKYYNLARCITVYALVYIYICHLGVIETRNLGALIKIGGTPEWTA